MTLEDVLNAIRDGVCDDDYNVVVKAINTRRKYLDSQKDLQNLASLEVGQRVELAGLRPKYLVGMTGEVVSKDGSTFDVLLDEQFRNRADRFVDFTGILTRVKPSMLQSL